MNELNGAPQLNVSGKNVNAQSKKEITQSMVMMLRTLITLAQTLTSIPDSRYITMKLLYFENVTPVDYEPQFFRAMRDDETKMFQQDFAKVKIGSIQTQYHTMNIRLRTQSAPEDDIPQQKVDDVDTQVSDDDREEVRPTTTNHNSQPSNKEQVVVNAKDNEQFEQLPPSQHHEEPLDENTQYNRMLLFLYEHDQSSSITSTTITKEFEITAWKAKEILARMEKENFLTSYLNRKRGREVIRDITNKLRIEKIKVPQAEIVTPTENVPNQSQVKAVQNNEPLQEKKRKRVDESQEVNGQIRMSTVQTPITQKKRKLYRDPKNTTVGMPADNN
ncbi:HORMA domain-containing protein [Acrasis kona]|uniref:HORMA domain-containing protein n=1 Tax=Acrasis kona TaxID=1008807 RepID=A0AAW2YQM8_9EUKA